MNTDDESPLSSSQKPASATWYDGGTGVCMVVGASRGIGYTLVEQLLSRKSVTQVIATCRPDSDQQALLDLQHQHGSRLVIRMLDVSNYRSLATFSLYLQTLEGGVDLAIHAAGILHEEDIEPERSLEQCNPRHLLRLFEVNSIGPLMVAKALMPIQSRSRAFVFIALSAMVGSIGDNRLGGWYGYRASKTALNQFVKTLSIECKLRNPKAAIVAIHPGTTDTDLSRPFQGSVRPGKLYSTEQTANRILGLAREMDCRNSGKFYNWDGKEIPW